MQWQDEIEVVVAAAIMEEVVTIEAVAMVTTEAFEAGERTRWKDCAGFFVSAL